MYVNDFLKDNTQYFIKVCNNIPKNKCHRISNGVSQAFDYSSTINASRNFKSQRLFVVYQYQPFRCWYQSTQVCFSSVSDY